jgi:hypothetical protein
MLECSLPNQRTDNSRRHIAERGGQAADSRQQTADSRQQAADSRQQAADSRQQTANSRQRTGLTISSARIRRFFSRMNFMPST